jgi:hypothetical protein
MARQRAFERMGEISREDLLSAIASLRESTLTVSRRNGPTLSQTRPSDVAIRSMRRSSRVYPAYSLLGWLLLVPLVCRLNFQIRLQQPLVRLSPAGVPP